MTVKMRAPAPKPTVSTALPASAVDQRPRAVDGSAEEGLKALLAIEADVRSASSRAELLALIANETRKLTRARQIFVAGRSSTGSRSVLAISGLPSVEQSSPLVRDVTILLREIGRDAGHDKARDFDLKAYANQVPDLARAYPFPALAWLPFTSKQVQKLSVDGMLLARTEPWIEADLVVARRLASTYAHALGVIEAQPGRGSRLLFDRRRLALAGFISLLVLAIPVSMTTLAPAEIAPRAPFVVAAPIDGIVEDVVVEPNAPVVAGQPLVRFVDTTARNRLHLAERELQVASARVKKATQQAFTDVRGRHDLGIALAELELKTAERAFARDVLERSEIKAQKAGVAVYVDKKELIGRPAGTGEKLMLIADPKAVEVHVDMSLGDAIALAPGARVKVFLDADPLDPREAVVVLTDYQARVRPGNTLGFKVVARLTDDRPSPRLGARGTAQLYGDRVVLGYYLFRRPIAAFRQWSGL
jgi:multidrug efflux pump subunit AcrA (membrane-fusion protein)